jgi:hypothetical protein
MGGKHVGNVASPQCGNNGGIVDNSCLLVDTGIGAGHFDRQLSKLIGDLYPAK